MKPLDATLENLFIIFAFESVAVLIFLLIYYSLYKYKSRRFIPQVLARVFYPLMFIMFAKRNEIPDILSIGLGNCFLFIALSFDVFSIVTAHKKFNWKSFKILVALQLVVTIFCLSYYANNAMFRALFQMIISGVILSAGFIYVLRNKDRTNIQTVSSVFFVIITLVFVWRVNYVANNNEQFDLLASTPRQNIIFYLLFFMTVMFNMLFMLIIKEISEREISIKNKELLDLNHRKTMFFNIIAHDLKSPLSGLYRLGEMIWLDKEKTLIDEEVIDSLYKSSKNTFNLVDNLLKWAMSSSGSLITKPKSFELHNVVTEIVNLYEEIAKTKNIEIVNNVDRQTLVKADPNMINTVIRNLVSNALKFTREEGKISIESNRLNGNMVEVIIKDSGIGMPKKYLNNLFDIKSKFTRKGTNNETGTGLGLILCQEFVQKNGGEIRAESLEGKGSTFLFTVPQGNV